VALLGRSEAFVLRRDGELVAAIWFERLASTVVDMHVHVARDYRGRWVTPSTLRYLAETLRRRGYYAVGARPRPEHIPLVQRLGFVPCGPGYILPLYEP
jgi:GNAT superfamily N-acetyltransferase